MNLEKCQVFTPNDIVNDLLDYVGYTCDIYNKTVLENSCGNGNVLVQIVSRYIKDGLNKNYSLSDIKDSLQRNIYGYEIDLKVKDECIAKLDKIAEDFRIVNVKWSIFSEDTLKADIDKKFDYIIGNPPYMTYADLHVHDRKYIREHFSVCSDGKPDYYYAFIQLGIDLLSDNGCLAYVVPSNIFKTKYARKIRQYIRPYITDIYDYRNRKLFDEKLTNSSIIVCRNSGHVDSITYHDMDGSCDFRVSTEDNGWIFYPSQYQQISYEYRFGDYFHASYSVATLLNSVYVLSAKDFINDHLLVDNHKIERTILKHAASPKSQSYKKSEFIIFPYKYIDGVICPYTESELRTSYPYAYDYLYENKGVLEKRDNDEHSEWFCFGRSQALSKINQKKLLLSSLVTTKVKVYNLDDDVVPYSGIFIIPIGHLDLPIAKSILESDEFFEYVEYIGIHANGVSKRITAKDINEYRFSSKFLPNQ